MTDLFTQLALAATGLSLGVAILLFRYYRTRRARYQDFDPGITELCISGTTKQRKQLVAVLVGGPRWGKR